MSPDEPEIQIETLCAQGRTRERGPGEPLAPVIVPSSAYAFASQADVDLYHETGEGYLYSRYANPTTREVELLLADLEDGEDAAVFASGMAAISTTFLTLAGAGDRVAAQTELYGGSLHLLREVLPELGIEVEWLSRDELRDVDPGRLRGCALLFLETPINPTLRVVDVRSVSDRAGRAGVPVVADSTFATPVVQRLLGHGADLVVHSATKYLGGHGDLLGGAVVGQADLVERVALRRRATGGTMGAFTAFLLHRGIRTLAVRMRAHCRGAEAVAGALVRHPRVERVFYPGLPDHPDAEIIGRQMDGPGGMVSFTVVGGEADAVAVHDRLKLFARAGSLGGVESLVSIPARMSHRGLEVAEREAIGVRSNLVRLSVGLESPSDLIADLEQALDPS